MSFVVILDEWSDKVSMLEKMVNICVCYCYSYVFVVKIGFILFFLLYNIDLD